MSYVRQRSAEFTEGSLAKLNWPDPKSPGYADWHKRNVHEPIQEQQYQGQVAAARAHVQEAKQWREQGVPDRAARALKRAATERQIAAKMPRPGRTR